MSAKQAAEDLSNAVRLWRINKNDAALVEFCAKLGLCEPFNNYAVCYAHLDRVHILFADGTKLQIYSHGIVTRGRS